jgi:hypothetical protein
LPFAVGTLSMYWPMLEFPGGVTMGARALAAAGSTRATSRPTVKNRFIKQLYGDRVQKLTPTRGFDLVERRVPDVSNISFGSKLAAALDEIVRDMIRYEMSFSVAAGAPPAAW